MGIELFHEGKIITIPDLDVISAGDKAQIHLLVCLSLSDSLLTIIKSRPVRDKQGSQIL